MEMMELFALAICAMCCFIAALALNIYRNAILQYASQLIQAAESAISGSGMGAEKKAFVLAQMEAAGIHVTRWLSAAIDKIVGKLNESGAWLMDEAKQQATELRGQIDE